MRSAFVLRRLSAVNKRFAPKNPVNFFKRAFLFFSFVLFLAQHYRTLSICITFSFVFVLFCCNTPQGDGRQHNWKRFFLYVENVTPRKGDEKMFISIRNILLPYNVTPREGTVDKTVKPTHKRKLPRNTSQGDGKFFIKKSFQTAPAFCNTP